MRKALVICALAIGGAVVVAGALGASRASMEQAKDAGWDCAPETLVLGYYHCAPPGKPSLQDVIDGDTTAASIVLRAFHPDGTFAGIESLVRRDLLEGHVPPCRPESLPEWNLTPFGYYACHHFAA